MFKFDQRSHYENVRLKLFLDFELAVDVYELSKDQQSRIMEAKAEYLNSKVLDDSIANQEIAKWLDGKLYVPNLQMQNDQSEHKNCNANSRKHGLNFYQRKFE